MSDSLPGGESQPAGGDLGDGASERAPAELTELLAAAQAPGTVDELAGQQAIMAAFRGRTVVPMRRRLAPKAIGFAAAVAVVGAGAAAAAAGTLPASLQRPAHNFFHAPAPVQHRSTPRPSPSQSSSAPASSASTTTSPTGSPTGSATGSATGSPTGSAASGTATSSTAVNSSTPPQSGSAPAAASSPAAAVSGSTSSEPVR
jgi:hypothetical protein